MKKIVSLILPLIFLSFCSCGFFFTRFAEKMLAGMQEIVNDTGEVSFIAKRFKEENQRWPENQEELKDFTHSKKIPFDWARYAHIHFKPQDDGSLEISMLYAPPKKGVLNTVVGGPEQNKVTIQTGQTTFTKTN